MTNQARDLLLVDENLDPPIATPTVSCAVVGDRLARAVGNHANLSRVEALIANQISGDTRSAPLSELVVVGLMADAVGIAGDHEDAIRRRRRCGGGGRSLHISEECIDLALGVRAQGCGSGREGRTLARIQDQLSLKVEIIHLGLELLLLARDRFQLITDPRAGGKASTDGEKQPRPDEGSDPDPYSIR